MAIKEENRVKSIWEKEDSEGLEEKENLQITLKLWFENSLFETDDGN